MRHVIQDTDVLLIYIILIVWLYFCPNFDAIHSFEIQERHQYGLYINILLIFDKVARCIVYGYMISNDLSFS